MPNTQPAPTLQSTRLINAAAHYEACAVARSREGTASGDKAAAFLRGMAAELRERASRE